MKAKTTQIVELKKIESIKDIQDLRARAGRVSAARREADAIKTIVSDTAKRTRETKDFAPLATETAQDRYDVTVADLLGKLGKLGISLEMLASAPVKQADKKAA